MRGLPIGPFRGLRASPGASARRRHGPVSPRRRSRLGRLLALATLAAAGGLSGQETVSLPDTAFLFAEVRVYDISELDRPEREDALSTEGLTLLRTIREWRGPDGRRLREETRDADGVPGLIMLFQHDAEGEETGLVYFESDPASPSVERFEWNADRTTRTTVYLDAEGNPGERTDSDRDEAGREIRKRYYRADGSMYGRETAYYDEAGRYLGWDFRYVEREGGASFRYDYLAFDATGNWTRRVMRRDGAATELQVRRIEYASPRESGRDGLPELERVGPGSASTAQAWEESPALWDGALLFLRSETDEWPALVERTPWALRLGDDRSVRRLELAHRPYTIVSTLDRQALLYSTRDPETGEVRSWRSEGDRGRWGDPADLTAEHGIRGSYLTEVADGSLYYYAAEGPDGPGIYVSRRRGSGFEPPRRLAATINDVGDTNFAPLVDPEESVLLFTRFHESDGERLVGRSGFYLSRRTGDGWSDPTKIDGLPYGWGARIREGTWLIFSDGRDILQVPLEAIGLDWPDA